MTSCEMPGRDTQSNVNALTQHIMASFLNRNWRTLFGQGSVMAGVVCIWGAVQG